MVCSWSKKLSARLIRVSLSCDNAASGMKVHGLQLKFVGKLANSTASTAEREKQAKFEEGLKQRDQEATTAHENQQLQQSSGIDWSIPLWKQFGKRSESTSTLQTAIYDPQSNPDNEDDDDEQKDFHRQFQAALRSTAPAQPQAARPTDQTVSSSPLAAQLHGLGITSFAAPVPPSHGDTASARNDDGAQAAAGTSSLYGRPLPPTPRSPEH